MLAVHALEAVFATAGPDYTVTLEKQVGSAQGKFDVRFWLLISATFVGFVGIGTVLPALGPHVKYDLRGSDQVVGAVIGRRRDSLFHGEHPRFLDHRWQNHGWNWRQ
jgi:hypothetical protein